MENSDPNETYLPLENITSILGDSEKPFFVLDMGIGGDASGRIFLLFLPDDARILSGILLGKSPEEIDFEDDLF